MDIRQCRCAETPKLATGLLCLTTAEPALSLALCGRAYEDVACRIGSLGMESSKVSQPENTHVMAERPSSGWPQKSTAVVYVSAMPFNPSSFRILEYVVRIWTVGRRNCVPRTGTNTMIQEARYQKSLTTDREG